MTTRTLLAGSVLGWLAVTGLAQTETVFKAELDEPYGIAIDTSVTNNFYYITDSVRGRVLQITPGTGEVLDLTGPALFDPQGIILARGGLVVAEAGRNRLRLATVTGSLTDLAGGAEGYVDGPAASALFNAPSGLAIDQAGNIYIADSRNDVIRKLAPDNTVSTYATGFNRPTGLALGEGGRLFVADTGNHVVKVIEPDGRISVVAGRVGSNIYTDDLNGPRGLLWLGGKTGLLVSDTGNSVIRQVANPFPGRTNSWSMTTYAGGYRQIGSAEGPAAAARFFEPVGLALDLDGAIAIADLKNNAVRRLKRPETKPPVLVPPGGGFSNRVDVAVSSLTTNAVFFYTTDGTDPTPSSTLFPAALSLNGGPVGLKVRAFSPDFGASQVISNNFSFFVEKLELNTTGGNFTNDVAMTVSTKTLGVTVRYSTNSDPPTVTSPVWSDGDWGLSGPLKLQGYRSGYTPSTVAELDFDFTVGEPYLTPPGPAKPAITTNNPVLLTLATGTRGATIFFAHREADVISDNPNRFLYSGPFVLGTNGLVWVQAFKPGYRESMRVSSEYHLIVDNPVIEPSGAVSNNDVRVKLSSGTTSAAIYWTILGEDPTQASTLYTGPFDLGTNGTLRAKAFLKGFEDSGLASAKFELSAADPVISPRGATNADAVSVTLTSATTDARIYWTINGDEPTESSALYAGPFSLGTNGTLKVRAFKAGYLASGTARADFALKTATPTIAPNGIAATDGVAVTLASATPDAKLYWTIDGTAPTESSRLYAGPFTLGTNGVMKVRAFRGGFVESEIASAEFKLAVANPVLTPAGTTNDRPVSVSMATATPSAEIRWTIDGADPTKTTILYGAPFNLATNGVVKARAFRAGFTDSEIVSANFNLVIATPTVTPASGTNINQVIATASLASPDAELRYTLDGTDPTATSTLYVGPLTVETNTTLKVAGFRQGFLTSPIVVRTYGIQVDTPVMSPAGGFFPDGTSITLTKVRPDATIRYTLDGTDPVAESTAYAGPFKVNALVTPGLELQKVKARAFAPNTFPSAVVSGQPLAASGIGIPRDVLAGVGAKVVVPVVVNLKAGDVLKSLQYKVLLWPNATATNLTTEIQPLSWSANDFVTQLSGSSESGGPTTYSTTAYTVPGGGGVLTNVLEVSMLGTNANLNVKSFATVAMLAVSVPTNATQGDSYSIQVAYPSGTSDGQQTAVRLEPLPASKITVTNLEYTVGDSSPGHWYNAGDFGNGDLDNADVNNAFNASLGFRVPYSFSDVFDAMDAFPDDTAAAVGGDGQIRYLDWQRILRRALRRDAVNWKRNWSTNGVRVASNTDLHAAALLPAGPTDLTVQGQPWPDVELGAESVGNVQPGESVAVPCFVQMLQARGLTGLQFRAIVQPEGGAPALEVPLEFTPAAGLPTPVQLGGLPPNQVGNAWSPLLNPLAQALVNRALVGQLRFAIPASAQPGQSYQVTFANADGAPDLDTPFDFATLAGTVKVGAPAPPGAVVGARGFKLRWQAAVGQTFVVESTTDLAANQWTVEADNLQGRGRVLEFLEQHAADNAKFYRVRGK